MELDYNTRLINIENEVQDKSLDAWKKLCEYVEIVAEEGRDEFSPYEYLGMDYYIQIHTLPKSIAKLKKVKKIWLYRSQLKRIPPEIGAMESLEYFDPYTSYHLHWYPYEILNCTQLKDSRVSTRALYGNKNYRRPFPDLSTNRVRYERDIIPCSICKKVINQQATNQLWISSWVGTDVLPLLVNACSKECEHKLPTPARGYVPYPHKGGEDLVQPTDENPGRYSLADLQKMNLEKKEQQKGENKSGKYKTTEVIRKIWER